MFGYINSVAGRVAWLDGIIVFFGEYVLYIIIATLISYAAIAWYSGKRKIFYGYLLALTGTIVARFGVEPLIHLFLYRPRPYLALQIPHLLTETSASFPSGHTIFIFALATGVFFVNRRLAYIFFAAGLLVGIARVAAGVHYPSDILGGMVLGLATAVVVHAMWKRVIHRVSSPISR